MESGRKEALGVVGRSKSAPAKTKGPTAAALEAKESLQVWWSSPTSAWCRDAEYTLDQHGRVRLKTQTSAHHPHVFS
jgi:hypothetical protein